MILFTFTFTILSHTLVNMLNTLHSTMNQSKYVHNKIIYRKRIAPCRIVPLETLIQTNNVDATYFNSYDGILVNHNGLIPKNIDDCWKPMEKQTLPISINANGWDGLRKRFQSSNIDHVEVF